MKALHVIAWILLVIGGLNWGILGLSGVNVVGYVGPTLSNIIYILVGIAALVELFTHKKNCKCCSSSSSSMPSQSM